MNLLHVVAAAAAITVLSTGCSRQEAPEDAIPEGYKAAVEKAKGVETQLDQSLQLQEQRIEDSEP